MIKIKVEKPDNHCLPLPIRIHRLSDSVELVYIGVKAKSKNQQLDLHTYKYTNGILKDTLVDYTLEEINRQLNNYWRESI
jgi:hypothetical protein